MDDLFSTILTASNINPRFVGVRVHSRPASTRGTHGAHGHDSTQAAIIYQHATAEADWAIVRAVDKALKAERKRSGKARGNGDQR